MMQVLRADMVRRLLVSALVGGVVAGGGLSALSPAPAAPVVTAQAAEAVASGLAVSGEGRVQATPDVAYVNLGVQTQGATANEAMGKNGAALNAVIAKVKELGIADADIQTADISLYPQYDNQQPRGSGLPPTVVGYQANASIRVTVNDISKAVWVLDGAVQAGANQAHGIQFAVKDPTSLRARALTLAAQQARARAEALAAGLGLRVIGVRSATDGAAPQPLPVRGGGVEVAPIAAPAGAPVPVQPGQLTVFEHVSVVFDVAQ